MISPTFCKLLLQGVSAARVGKLVDFVLDLLRGVGDEDGAVLIAGVHLTTVTLQAIQLDMSFAHELGMAICSRI